MNHKTHFISFGVVLQLVHVLSCTLPSWMEGTFQDGFAPGGTLEFTSSDKLTWRSLEVGGESTTYTCVDRVPKTLIYVWRSSEQLSTRPGKYIYVCMLYMDYDKDSHAYFLLNDSISVVDLNCTGIFSEKPNADAENHRVVLSEDANLKTCDVCSIDASVSYQFARDIWFIRFNRFNCLLKDPMSYKIGSGDQASIVLPVVDLQTNEFTTFTIPATVVEEMLNCKLTCEEYLDVYTTLLTNVIQKILTKGIKCDDQGNANNNGKGQGGFDRDACKCFQTLNENINNFRRSECNEFLISQK